MRQSLQQGRKFSWNCNHTDVFTKKLNIITKIDMCIHQGFTVGFEEICMKSVFEVSCWIVILYRNLWQQLIVNPSIHSLKMYHWRFHKYFKVEMCFRCEIGVYMWKCTKSGGDLVLQRVQVENIVQLYTTDSFSWPRMKDSRVDVRHIRGTDNETMEGVPGSWQVYSDM